MAHRKNKKNSKTPPVAKPIDQAVKPAPQPEQKPPHFVLEVHDSVQGQVAPKIKPS